MNLINWFKDLFLADDNRPIGLKQIKGTNNVLQVKEAPLFTKKEKVKISDLIKGEIY